MSDQQFKAGDIVTRDGSDLHLVTRADDGDGSITVVCIKEPNTGWMNVGESEDNLSGRYHFAGSDRILEVTSEIARLRAALKDIQAKSVGVKPPRHSWYYDRAEEALATPPQS